MHDVFGGGNQFETVLNTQDDCSFFFSIMMYVVMGALLKMSFESSGMI